MKKGYQKQKNGVKEKHARFRSRRITYKIIKVEEILWCSNEISGITKSLLKTVWNNKNGDLTTEINMFKFEE